MLNTEISYVYRDSSNYKQYNTLVLNGEISQIGVEIIISKLIDQQFFIPEQVGLPALQKRFITLTSDDHPYHELLREDIRIVSSESSIELNIDELVERFRTVIWDLLRADMDLWQK